jgi:hypothetical protein
MKTCICQLGVALFLMAVRYGKVNLATWNEMKWRDLKAKVLSESFSRTKLALL